MPNSEIPAIRASALKLLTMRQHTERELEKKLSRKGYSTPSVLAVIKQLKQQGYVDDESFAARYAEQKRRNAKSGKKLLIRQLYAKGVSREIIHQTVELGITEEEEFILAKEAAEKKIGQWQSASPDTTQFLRKASGYLKRKGFSDSIIIKVLNLMIQSDNWADSVSDDFPS